MATKQRAPSGSGVTIIKSTVDTGGGDIVGRDKIHDASVQQVDALFEPLVREIDGAPPAAKVAASESLRQLKNEVAKGKDAGDPIIAKLIEGLVGLVPSAVSAIAGAFASPVLAGVTGNATKYVLDKIQGSKPPAFSE